MNTASYLKYLRRRLRDVDDTAPLYADAILLEYTQDALLILTARKITGLDGYIVDTQAETITPDFVDNDAILVSARTAGLLLKDLYTEKVRSGELGVSWQSGIEHESTIDMRKAFAQGVAALEDEVQELILLRASTTSGFRSQ